MSVRHKNKVVLCFSQVISSNIYESILRNYVRMDLDVICVFFGHETVQLQRYATKLQTQTIMLNVSSGWHIFISLLRYVRHLIRFKPRAVITFGQTATLIGLFGAFLNFRSIRVYFRQHTSSNKMGKFSKGNIYDSVSNFLAKKIIVSNRNTYMYLVANEGVSASKISICEFGFDVDSFVNKDLVKVNLIKAKYDLNNFDFVVGIVSRVTLIKGLEFALQGFKKFLVHYPNSVILLANAMDADKSELAKLIEGIPTQNIRILEREFDMISVYACMDTLVHVPINVSVESYGLVYVEAFLSKLPTIITISGIANQIAVHEENCLVVEYQDSNQICHSLIRLREHDELRLQLGQNAFDSVSDLNMDKMDNQFRKFLQDILG